MGAVAGLGRLAGVLDVGADFFDHAFAQAQFAPDGFQFLLFILVDGWHLVCESLVTSFNVL